jgi:hypothetical protein
MAFEMHTITRPAFPPIFTKVVNPLLAAFGHPPLLPYQQLVLVRKVMVSIFIALSQLGPVLQPEASKVDSSEVALQRNLNAVVQLGGMLDQETSRIGGLNMAPFINGGEASVLHLRKQAKDWLVQNTIRNDPEVREAVGIALARVTGGQEAAGPVA